MKTCKRFNPNEAPKGYIAVKNGTCASCVFDNDSAKCMSPDAGCTPDSRKDGHQCNFAKRPAIEPKQIQKDISWIRKYCLRPELSKCNMYNIELRQILKRLSEATK